MDIFERTELLLKEANDTTISTAEELEKFRIRFLGTKNVLKDIFAEIKTVPNERKKEFGQLVNSVKQAAEDKFTAHQEKLQHSTADTASIDLTLPGDVTTIGARHPIQIVKNQIVDIFKRLGFAVEEDREIEDDWHNFTALNTPSDHPARDMQELYPADTDAQLVKAPICTGEDRATVLF